MATITSVNNTTVGATYNIHDPATWIGGVVPGPNDVVVFQSATATTWFLTQDWTIQGITWTVSSNKSESGIEIPNTVTQNITFTQTVTSWAGSAGPMWSDGTDLRLKPWLKVNNPVNTTFTLNLPGSLWWEVIGGSVSSGNAISGETNTILCTQAGTAIFNIPGLIRGHAFAFISTAQYSRSAIVVSGSSGYTEINCGELRAGYTSSTSSTHGGLLHHAVSVRNLTGSGSVEINCSSIGASIANAFGNNTNGCGIYLAGSIANGVTINSTGGIRHARNSVGNIFDSHTSGTFTINAVDIAPFTEPWAQGYNEDYTQSAGKRTCYYGNGGTVSAVTIFDCNIYGPNNAYNVALATLNHSMITYGACTHYFYGDLYSTSMNRSQVPFYYDNDNVLWYHMSGTAYNSINQIVYSTRVPYIGFTGGYYHANVVQSNDPGNTFSPNRTPFAVSTLTPNPNYTGGNQMSWTYVKGAANRAETTVFVNANYTGYSPAESNVRLGTVYGNGLRTGTCAVPQPHQVYLGTPVDNTLGTLTGETTTLDTNTLAAAIWNYNLNNITNTTNGPGQRLLNNATIESTGEQIAALGV